MVANLVEIKCHVFMDLDYYFHHICSHVIGTFQERAINDALQRFVDRLTNVSIMFSQRSTSLIKTSHYL